MTILYFSEHQISIDKQTYEKKNFDGILHKFHQSVHTVIFLELSHAVTQHEQYTEKDVALVVCLSVARVFENAVC